MNLSSYQGIIFDCDGVLISSREANKKFYNMILKNLFLPEMSREQEEYVHCHTVSESLQYIVPEHLVSEAKRTAENISYEQVLPYIELQEGLFNFLQVLSKLKVRCAVNTNRSNTMKLILEKFRLFPYFSPVITSLDVQNPKPDPESVFYILNFWNVHNKSVVFIGDSWVDEQTAISAGVEFWAYKNPDLKEATLNISDYKEISEQYAEKLLSP